MHIAEPYASVNERLQSGDRRMALYGRHWAKADIPASRSDATSQDGGASAATMNPAPRKRLP